MKLSIIGLFRSNIRLLETAGNAIVEMLVSSVLRHLVAVSYIGLKKYITAYLASINNHYIASYILAFDEIAMLSSIIHLKNALPVISTLSFNAMDFNRT